MNGKELYPKRIAYCSHRGVHGTVSTLGLVRWVCMLCGRKIDVAVIHTEGQSPVENQSQKVPWRKVHPIGEK